MSYLLICYGRWSSLIMGEYETYGEALLAMLKFRMWLYDHHDYNIVRIEIQEEVCNA